MLANPRASFPTVQGEVEGFGKEEEGTVPPSHGRVFEGGANRPALMG
jgi:hypothetical protein